MNKLTLMVGLPRSGKSTLCKRMGIPIVNPDSIRIAIHGQRFIGSAEPMVWAVAKYMVVALFEAGHEHVVLDATNTTIQRRNEWADKRWTREFFIVGPGKEVCISRAAALEDAYIIPIIEKMAEQYEPYTGAELRDWEK